MKQSSRSAVVPARWRRLTRGLLLTAAVLGLTVTTVPAASAAPTPAPPHVGSVRHLDLDFDVTGAVPLGTRLSGVGFTFTSPAGTGTCLTNLLSHCDVDWTGGAVAGSGTSQLRLPTGTYTVTQDAARSLPGVQPRTGPIATVTIGDHWVKAGWITLWQKTGSLTVANASLFRAKVTGRVVDAATGAPVEDALFRLSGPGLPLAGIDTTDANGQLSIKALLNLAIYRPGTWTLTPVGVDPEYDLTPLTVELTAAGVQPASLDLGTVRLSPPPPRTGTGTLSLQPTGPVPPALDLSGAEFRLTGDAATATCVTDAVGTCAVEVVPPGRTSTLPSTGAAQIALPAGTYTVDQESAPDGLTVDEDVEDLVLCTSTTVGECAATVVADDASAFRQTVSASVRRDGAPVEGMELTLTGPGYRVFLAEGIPADEESSGPAVTWPGYESAPVTTDEEGIAVWRGWFVPGSWTVTAADVDEPLHAFELGATTELLEIELPSTEVPDTGTGPDGGAGEVTGAPSTSGAPSPTGVPGTVGSPGGAGSASSANAAGSPGRGSQAAGPRAAAPTTDAAPAPAAGTSAAPRDTAPRPTGSPVVVDGDQVFIADEEPDLQTAGSTDLLSPGLVLGVGILFVALVVAGVMVLRRRSGRV